MNFNVYDNIVEKFGAFVFNLEKKLTRRKPHELSFCDKYEWTKSDIWELVTFITNFRKNSIFQLQRSNGLRCKIALVRIKRVLKFNVQCIWGIKLMSSKLCGSLRWLQYQFLISIAGQNLHYFIFWTWWFDHAHYGIIKTDVTIWINCKLIY